LHIGQLHAYRCAYKFNSAQLLSAVRIYEIGSSYFKSVQECFSSIVAVCDERSLIVQMVAFSNRHDQLPRYLTAMRKAGLKEVGVRSHVHGPGERIWRQVPNRKWYAEQRTNVASASELVLFHRKR
jgi:hypothetical protein